MTEQPPLGDYPPSSWGAGSYGGQPPEAPGGFVMLPEIGTVAVATIWQRLLARLIDALIYGVFYAIFLVIGASVVSSSAVTDFHGHTTFEHFGLETPGLLLALAGTAVSGLVYEWLMLAYKGATLGKMALGIKVVNSGTGHHLSFGSAFVRPLVPLAASVFCNLLGLLVYISPLFDRSGRLRGWHDRAADDVVIKVR